MSRYPFVSILAIGLASLTYSKSHAQSNNVEVNRGLVKLKTYVPTYDPSLVFETRVVADDGRTGFLAGTFGTDDGGWEPYGAGVLEDDDTTTTTGGAIRKDNGDGTYDIRIKKMIVKWDETYGEDKVLIQGVLPHLYEGIPSSFFIWESMPEVAELLAELIANGY